MLFTQKSRVHSSKCNTTHDVEYIRLFKHTFLNTLFRSILNIHFQWHCAIACFECALFFFFSYLFILFSFRFISEKWFCVINSNICWSSHRNWFEVFSRKKMSHCNFLLSSKTNQSNESMIQWTNETLMMDW